MKYWIETNEVWPEYTPRNAWDASGVATIEIPNDFMARYNAAATEWAAVQATLEDTSGKRPSCGVPTAPSTPARLASR